MRSTWRLPVWTFLARLACFVPSCAFPYYPHGPPPHHQPPFCLAVYFVQGILGLSRLALSFFYKDDLHMEPAAATAIMGLSALPWMIKPLYGFISDSIPLFGYRRRSYLVICGLLGVCMRCSATDALPCHDRPPVHVPSCSPHAHRW